MNFPEGLFPAQWSLAAWLPLAVALAVSVARAPWRSLAQPGRSHVWLGAVVTVMLMWSLKAGIRPGLSLHLLGAMALVLTLGPHLAMLGLGLVLAAVTANGDAGWSAFALNALTMVVVPVAVAGGVLRLVDEHLPNHFFVFVFVAAFLGGALTLLAAGLAGTALLVLAGVYPPQFVAAEYLPYVGLMAFSEAWLGGVVVTMLVVYRPAWVASFDDSRYLANK